MSKEELHTMNEISHMVRHLVQTSVTKDDVREIVENVIDEKVPPMIHKVVTTEINKAKQELMDYTDRRLTKTEGILTARDRKINEKVDAFIDCVAQDSPAVAKNKEHLKGLGPFPAPNGM